ncbi:dienelactone hydrolase family protein [Egbenema bharatensis]|uniref:dienelactone hydrolase family protein n=1 Tax=Egbenema bharatensis TaxID=3463334 RepID=UPI003A8B9A5C
MRRWFGLALISCFMVLIGALLQPASDRLIAAETESNYSAQQDYSQDYGQRLMHSHQGDRPIATPIVAQAPAIPVVSERVTYGSLEGTPVQGYLARPADATEPLPGLIVIHEWWGVNDNIEMMTDRLAGEGYTALAVDLFEGQVADTPEQAREQVQAALQTPERLEENLRQAFQYLQTEQESPSIASIGWCFGGTWSLNTALLFPEDLDAVVIYYGGQITTDAETLSPLQMPILGIFGELDDNPSPETVREFEATLNELGKSAEILIYEDADHAFANPSGTRYNAVAAEDAWNRTIAFLNQHLQE